MTWIWANTGSGNGLLPDCTKPFTQPVLTDSLVYGIHMKLNRNTGLILGVHPANERRNYIVATSLIGWAPA